MKANNYDTNSKGLNIEVNIFSDFTNEEFNTNITKLKDGNYFLNAQEFDHNSLGFNLKGTNDALLSYLKDYTNVTGDITVKATYNETVRKYTITFKNEDETNVNKREIQKLAYEKFGKSEGLAQQYLFYWKREA